MVLVLVLWYWYCGIGIGMHNKNTTSKGHNPVLKLNTATQYWTTGIGIKILGLSSGLMFEKWKIV